MKTWVAFFLGFLLCLGTQTAKCLNITVDPPSVRDIFAATCLAGLISRYGANKVDFDLANFCFQTADSMMKRRNK